MLEKCPACNGRKQVMKLGMILGDCTECSALGHVKSIPDLPTEPVKEVTRKARKALDDKEV